MRLRELSGVDSDSEVTGFAIDHRKVAPGSVFGAFKGQVFDGEDFIGQAVEVVAITMAVYLTISLSISAFMNWYNARAAIKER